MTAGIKAYVVCNGDGCTARVSYGQTPAEARLEAERQGWAVKVVRGTLRPYGLYGRGGCDYCPQDRPG